MNDPLIMMLAQTGSEEYYNEQEYMMPSLNQELEALLDTYNIETIVYKLAAICWDEAEHTQDKELAKEYHKLGNKLQHTADTSSINHINQEKIKAFEKERQMAGLNYRA